MLGFQRRLLSHFLFVGFAAAFLTGLLPVDSASAQGVWSLSKTPSPATYTAAGQVITYTYVVTNAGGNTGTISSLTDDKVAAINCPSSSVPPNGTLHRNLYDPAR